MATINTRKRLEEDLSALKNMIYRMGGMAAESVEQAVWALKNSDAELAQKVIDDGDLIDELEEKVDAGCMEFAARYQPLGEDLRVVVSLMHIAVDLERIGDYGENIAKAALDLSKKPQLKPLIDIPRMVEILKTMLSTAMEALDKHDGAAALKVFPYDDDMDDLDKQIIRELLLLIMEKPERIEQSLSLMSVSRIPRARGRPRDERCGEDSLHVHGPPGEGLRLPPQEAAVARWHRRYSSSTTKRASRSSSAALCASRATRRSAHTTADNALSLVYEEMPDLVILDLMLPLMDGWEICRRVKSDEETRHIPILMLTARSSAEDVVQGLDLGADDYMRKPFPLDELLARVRVLLRRSQGPADTKKVIEDRDFKLDTVEKEVWLRGSIIDLSPTEYSILEVLARRMGHTVSRDELLRKIWGLGSCDTRTVDVHMSRLRRKLDDGKKPTLSAQTLRGRGYRLTWEEGE